MTTAISLQNEAARFAADGASKDDLQKLGLKLQHFHPSPGEEVVIEQAFENLALAYARCDEIDFQILRPLTEERLIEADDDFLNIPSSSPIEQPVDATTPLQLELDRHTSLKDSSFTLLDRIYKAFRAAFTALLDWIASFFRGPSQSLQTPPFSEPARSLPEPAVPAPQEPRPVQKRQETAGSVVSQQTAIQALTDLWIQLIQKGLNGRSSPSIDVYLHAPATSDSNLSARELLNVETPDPEAFVRFLDSLELAAIMNRKEKMRGSIMNQQDRFHILLAHATKEGVTYYYANFEQIRPDVRRFENKAECLQFLLGALSFEKEGWNIKTYGIDRVEHSSGVLPEQR